ncbi:hypothetical protein LINPERPRIM_LOCUS22566, partial [Linum perenne]
MTCCQKDMLTGQWKSKCSKFSSSALHVRQIDDEPHLLLSNPTLVGRAFLQTR